MAARPVVVRSAADGDQGIDPRVAAADLGRAAAFADDFPLAEHRHGDRPHGGLRPRRLSDGARRADGAYGRELPDPPPAPPNPHPPAAAPPGKAGIQPPADLSPRDRGGRPPPAALRL